MCQLVSADSQRFYSVVDLKHIIKLENSYKYSLLKNCFELLRNYCLIIKYVEYLANKLSTLEELNNIIPKDVRYQC